MACLSKIASAITYDCDSGNTGFSSAVILNKEDIASLTFNTDNPALLINLVLKAGASAYKIDTVKRTLVATESLKVNEGAPNAYTHTVTVTVTGVASSLLFRNLINPMANGSFVVLTKAITSAGSTPHRVYGLYYGMSVTNVERSSHENGGWYTITMATPERVIGEDALSMSDVNYQVLYDAAIG